MKRFTPPEIQYQNIVAFNKSTKNVKDMARYARYWHNDSPDKEKLAADQLTLFTAGPSSKDETKHNLEIFQEYAQRERAELMVVTANCVQFVGGRYKPSQYFEFPENNEDRNKYYWYRNSWQSEQGDQGLWLEEYWAWQPMLTRTDQQKVYDVNTLKPLPRRQAIQRLWDLGFVSQRGRPIMAAKRRECGWPSEVAKLQAVADEHQYDINASAVANKLILAWKSLAKSYCWPGQW